MRLQDKVALVTGASSGIGRATCLLFAREGAKVVLVDINDEGGDETLQAIKKEGGEAIYVHADISKAADCENMITVAEETFGGLHVIFNNAGISHAADDDALNTSEEVWDLTFAINVKGVFLGCKYGIPASDAQVGARSSIPPLLWRCWALPHHSWPIPPAREPSFR